MSETYDIGTIKRHAFLAAFGSDVIGPLAGAPQITAVRKTYDSTIYENGGNEAVASLMLDNTATVTLTTKDVGKALELLNNFSSGDDLLAASRKRALSFTPIGNSTEKVLVFTDAYLQPELSYIPTMGGDHTARLVFKALANATTGKLYEYA